jgi:hypothetical protein
VGSGGEHWEGAHESLQRVSGGDRWFDARLCRSLGGRYQCRSLRLQFWYLSRTLACELSSILNEPCGSSLSARAASRTWSQIECSGDAPPKRLGHTSVCNQGHMYIFGGTYASRIAIT